MKKILILSVMILFPLQFLESQTVKIANDENDQVTLSKTKPAEVKPLIKKRVSRKKKKNSRRKITPEQIYKEANYLVKLTIYSSTTAPSAKNLIPDPENGFMGFGSGSIVRCEKFKYCVLTAYHVVSMSSVTFYAEFRDGSPPQKLELISKTTDYDAAILKFQDENFKPKKTARIGNASKLKAGEKIMAMGSSIYGDFWFSAIGYLYAKAGPPNPVLKEVFKSQNLSYPKIMIMDLNIFPGYSGGPILNRKGELVGISFGFIRLSLFNVVYLGSPIDEIKQELKILK